MPNKDYNSLFQKIGLSKKESSVYLYGLSSGAQTVTHLARGTGLTRTNGYDIVRRLSSLGLCKNLGSSYGKKILMLNPEHLTSLIEQKKHDLNDLQNELDTSLPQLSKLQNKILLGSPRISYVEGVEGVRQLFEELLRTNIKEFHKVIGTDNIMNILGESFLEDWIIRRVRRNISVNVLKPWSLKNNQHSNNKASDPKKLREVRYLPKEVSQHSSLLIFDNKVVEFTNQGPLYGVMIESDALTDTRRSWFNYFWDQNK